MRLAVLSDIHGNLHALEAVLADLESAGEVDLIWHLGDYAAFGGNPAGCVRRIREMTDQHGDDKVRCIGGNTDRYLITGERPSGSTVNDADAFASLADNYARRDAVLNWGLEQLSWEDYDFLRTINGREMRKRVDGFGTIIGVHAVPGDDESQALAPDSADELAQDALLDRQGQLILVGHTHRQMNREIGHWRAINPGSIGMSFTDSNYAEWALLTIADDGTLTVDLRRVEYDIAAMVSDLETGGHPHPHFFTGKL